MCHRTPIRHLPHRLALALPHPITLAYCPTLLKHGMLLPKLGLLELTDFSAGKLVETYIPFTLITECCNSSLKQYLDYILIQCNPKSELFCKHLI